MTPQVPDQKPLYTTVKNVTFLELFHCHLLRRVSAISVALPVSVRPAVDSWDVTPGGRGKDILRPP